MKNSRRFEHQSEHKQEIAESAEFHSQRMSREQKIETKQGASIQPAGTDEYEQLVAEEAHFNAKPMIEEAAFFLAEHRGFEPGNELSDWLQAEDEVEGLLRGASIERRTVVVEDRREA